MLLPNPQVPAGQQKNMTPKDEVAANPLLKLTPFKFLRMFATSCSQRACQAQTTWLKLIPTGNPAG